MGATEVAEPVVGGLCAPRKDLPYQSPRDTIGIRLMSDLHVGAQHVDYKLIRREVEEAIANGYRIAVNGDVFDAVVAHDKRFTPDVLHPRLQGRRDVHNECVRMAAELFSGAEHLIDMVGVGNHEESVTKYAGFDINQAFVYELQRNCNDKDHTISFGGYGGFLDYRFRIKTGGKSRTSEKPQRLLIYYHHGSGGAAPVTGGMINFNRKAVWVNADVIWMGHQHNRVFRDTDKITLTPAGNLSVTPMRYIMTGAYFDTYQIQSQKSYRDRGRVTNYAADWGVAPQGKGGVLLLVDLVANEGGSMSFRVVM